MGAHAVAFHDEAWPNRVSSRYEDQTIWVIGRDDLVANKRAAGPAQDLLDLATLEKHKSSARSIRPVGWRRSDAASYRICGKPRLTPRCWGSGQRAVTTFPRV